LQNTEIVVTDPEPYPVAYLRVAGGKLIEKEGWTKPGVGELREMLGLGGDEGVEGLDEPGRELLGDLRQSIQGRVDEEDWVSEEVSTSSVDLDEEVRFGEKEKWFAASITGVTQGNESIGEELARCFDSIQCKYSTSSPGANANDQQH
jgi:diphthine-ammonia ligase